jgi:8-oxo-dGTP diphosphatase
VNHQIIAKTLLQNNQGKILVLRRSPNDEDSPGRVDLPGGGVEIGERYIETAAREIVEEAGLLVSEQDLSLVYTFTKFDESNSKIITRFLFTGSVIAPKVKLSHEHDKFWWFSPQELPALFEQTSWSEAIAFMFECNLLHK